MKRSLSLGLSVALTLTLLSTEASAVAPARYQALGATIGYINDGTALRFNPAGISHVDGGSVIVSFSPIFGGINAPIVGKDNVLRENVEDRQLDSEPIFGPGFMLSGAYRVTDWMTLGLAIYPVIAGGADYRYIQDPEEDGATPIQDKTSKLHAEVAPGLSFNVPKSTMGDQSLSFGVAYRIGYGNLVRMKGNPDDPEIVNIDAKGFDFGGVTVGLQYSPVPELELGLVYRHKVKVDMEGDKGQISVGPTVVDGPVKSDLVYPSMLGFGLRANLGQLSLVADVEYEFNSQVDMTVTEINNGASWLKSDYAADGVMPLLATYKYTDSINVKGGLEYRINDAWAVQGGYTWLQSQYNRLYPTPFGSPPTDNHIASIGGSYTASTWQMNVAYTYRFANTELVEADVDGQGDCNICTEEGSYSLLLQGVHIDFSYNF